MIIERDNITPSEARRQLLDAQRAVSGGEDPEEVLEDYFGLEPDYLFDLFPIAITANRLVSAALPCNAEKPERKAGNIEQEMI